MSSVTIQEVYHKLLSIEEHMVTKEELEPLIDTIEILSNHETMRALTKSDDDIKKGKVKSITGLDDLLAELDTE
jgi:hypothetical protein